MPRDAWSPKFWEPLSHGPPSHYRIGREKCCPMSFLPGAIHLTPGSGRDAGGNFSDKEVECFGRWWDLLSYKVKLVSALRALAKLRKPA